MKSLKLYISKLLASFGYGLYSRKRFGVVSVFRDTPPSRLNLLSLAIRALITDGFSPYVVQVGASDGISNDPLHSVIDRHKLSGLLVEPEPLSFSELQRNYANSKNVVLENCAVSSTSGQLKMYRCAGEDGRLLNKRQLTTCQIEHLLAHGVKENEIETITVPCLTFGDLKRKHNIHRIDVLQVDVEGNDDIVVRAALSLIPLPRVIHFEHFHIPSDRKNNLLLEMHIRGYEFAHTGIDTLAVLGEHIPTEGLSANF